MRWLHISDFHYKSPGKNYDTDKMLEKLRESITNGDIAVDEIFFTGDFRFAKDSDGVNASHVAEELCKIARLAGVNDPEHIHIVPGNHDLTRREIDEKFLDTACSQYANGTFHGEIAYDGKRMSCQQYLLNRFDFFFDVVCELKNPVWTKNSETLHLCREHGTYKIIYLNTAIVCGRDNERGKLVLGYNDLYRVLKHSRRELPGIALGHHGLENLQPAERVKVKQLFNENNVNLYLCGDAHFGESTSIDDVVQITAGCLTQGSGVAPAFFVGTLCDNGDKDIKAYTYDNNHPGWNKNQSFTAEIARKFSHVPSSIHVPDIHVPSSIHVPDIHVSNTCQEKKTEDVENLKWLFKRISLKAFDIFRDNLPMQVYMPIVHFFEPDIVYCYDNSLFHIHNQELKALIDDFCLSLNAICHLGARLHHPDRVVQTDEYKNGTGFFLIHDDSFLTCGGRGDTYEQFEKECKRFESAYRRLIPYVRDFYSSAEIDVDKLSIEAWNTFVKEDRKAKKNLANLIKQVETTINQTKRTKPRKKGLGKK